MENEIDHLLWNAKHSLSLLEGPLANELDGVLDVKSTKLSPVYKKIEETIQVLDKLLITLTPPHLTLVDGIFAFTNSKVLLCATEYKLADHIQKLQPVSIQDLASAAGVHELGLSQVMRYLGEMGYFTQDPVTKKFSNNRLSSLLLNDHWTTWIAWADFFPREYYDLISHLPSQLKIDQPKTATELFYKTDKPIYQYLAETGRVAEFHRVTKTGSVAEAPGLLNDYPWNEVSSETIMDIGAGTGDFIRAYLEQYPTATAGAFELPQTADVLQTQIPADDPIANRLVAVNRGDFFKDAIPAATVYHLRWILHNWNDEDSIKLLKRIREAAVVKPGVTRVLIVESVVFEGRLGRGARYADIRMLARCRSKERTLEEYTNIATQAGWKVERVVSPRGCLTQILELRPSGEVLDGNGHVNGNGTLEI
ncbi:O-methyltransferase [Talaromyces proteolyticus]|uniref:O-methyltransferase n=1 Tax=Talaromyces proteolyticus TaxID=1131652 RepID=A0AAD4L2U4_9EURO|nr:O-methyltransferase [Talaromyces proteolyticus]KAH8702194.1 O-methyltransferase [Talaromyces proteolyticus]